MSLNYFSVVLLFIYLVLRYADGVLPGQGSPDHTEDCLSTGNTAYTLAGTTAASGALTIKRSILRYFLIFIID